MIVDYKKLSTEQKVVIEQIFFDNSEKIFTNLEEKNKFKNLWLKPYLCNKNCLFYVMVKSNQVMGYINGSLATELNHREFTPFLRYYPAHLHINIHQDFQGVGSGKELVDFFCRKLEFHSVAGVHVITSPMSRNVKFYDNNGFNFRKNNSKGNLLFMGKTICA